MFHWGYENEWSQSPNNGGCVSHDNAVSREIGNKDCFLLANFFEKEVENDATSAKNDTHTCNVESDFFSYLSTMEDPFSSGIGSGSWHNFFPLDVPSTSAEFMDVGMHRLRKDFLEYQWDNIENFDGFDSVLRNKAKNPVKSLIIPGGSSASWENLPNSTEFFQLEKEPINHADIPFVTLHSTNQGIVHKKNKRECSTFPKDQHPLECRGEGGFCRNLLPFACLEQQRHLPDSESSDIHTGGSNSGPSFLTFQNTEDHPMCAGMMVRVSSGHQNSEHENPVSLNHFPTITAAGKANNYSRAFITESSHHILPPSSADLESGGEYCDPEGIVSQLQKVVAKMDANSRLLIRDCLFRLGRNAKRRRDTSTDTTSSITYAPYDCNRFDTDDNRCVRLEENDKNSIDRLVVHLLFKNPTPYDMNILKG